MSKLALDQDPFVQLVGRVGFDALNTVNIINVAGVGYPQLSAGNLFNMLSPGYSMILVLECADAAHGLNGHVISDGGCTDPGDVAKAFGGGADFVMAGGILFY